MAVRGELDIVLKGTPDGAERILVLGAQDWGTLAHTHATPHTQPAGTPSFLRAKPTNEVCTPCAAFFIIISTEPYNIIGAPLSS